MNKYRVLERDGLFYVLVGEQKSFGLDFFKGNVVWYYYSPLGNMFYYAPDEPVHSSLKDHAHTSLKEAWGKIKELKTPPKKTADIIHTEEQL